MKNIFGKKIPWIDCQMIDETRDEANSYLDVGNLLKKMKIINLTTKAILKA